MAKANQKVRKSTEEGVWFYHKKGFSIIPLGKNKGLWGNKEDELKRPSISTWKKYETTPPTEEEIQQWLDDGLFANIGVICGKVSNNLVVIDIDDASIPELIGIKFDKIMESGAWVVETGNGYHIYLKHNANPGGIKKPIKLKIEYRANNGYVVAPPSTHPNGSKYKFMNADNFEDLPKLEIKDVKSIFEKFSNKIREKWGIEKKSHATSGIGTIGKPKGYPKCVGIAMATVTKHPMRYYIIFGIASSFYMNNIPKDMALQRIKRFNLEKCNPPHSNNIVEQAVNGAYQPEAHRFGCEFWMDHAELCPYENVMECPFGKKKLKRELAKEYKIFTYKEKENKNGEKYYVKDGVKPPRLARLILEEHDFHFMTTKDNQEVYYYNDGCYHSNAEAMINQIAEEYMEDLTTTHRKNEVTNFIKDRNYIDRSKVFQTDINLIPLNNGIYNLNTDELIPHSPEHHFLSKIRVNYNPDAKCPKITKFFNSVLNRSNMNLLQEIFGYCLYRKYYIHKAIMFVGRGANGKGTTLALLRELLGQENVASVELAQLDQNTFAVADLYGKLANICADLPKTKLYKTGKFKMATGGDLLRGEKKFKDKFEFINYAKLLYSANQIPETEDDTDAFFRRWILMTFPYRFVDKNESHLIDNETIFPMDPKILEGLTEEKEMEGLLIWSIEGLKKLLKNGVFSYSKSTAEVQDHYERLSNPVTAFVKDEIEVNSFCYVTRDDLYEAYKNYADQNELGILEKQTFTKKLQKQPLPLMEYRPAIAGRPRCWRGIRHMIDETINNYIETIEEEKKNEMEKLF